MPPIPPLPRLQSQDPVFNRFQDGLHQVLQQVTAQEAWHAPKLLNGWANFSSTNLPAGYFKDSQGIVHVRGTIKSGTLNAPAFNLPASYRPSRNVNWPVASNSAFGYLAITSGGDVIPVAGSNVWFDLGWISFDTR